jgi:hypothetical protein
LLLQAWLLRAFLVPDPKRRLVKHLTALVSRALETVGHLGGFGVAVKAEAISNEAMMKIVTFIF